MAEDIRIRARRGLTAVAVVLGLVAPSPAGAVTVPQGVSFPPTHTGAESTVTVSFAAEGPSELMGAAVLDGDASFTIGEDTCSGQHVAGACTIEVRFAPRTAGERSATLRLSGARGDALVTLTGLAYTVGARLAASPELVTFPPLSPGLLSSPKRVTITARGDLPARIAGLTFEGPAPGDFVITADGCTRTTLSPGTKCVIEVRANPSRFEGSFARLRVLTDPPDASVTIGLTVLARSLPPAPGGGQGPGVIPPPWSLGIVAAHHRARRTTIRFYTNLPATVTVSLLRGRRSVRRVRRRITAGSVQVVVRGRLRRGRYRVRVVATRPSERRRASIRLRVR
jgi:hypothetical protein